MTEIKSTQEHTEVTHTHGMLQQYLRCDSATDYQHSTMYTSRTYRGVRLMVCVRDGWVNTKTTRGMHGAAKEEKNDMETCWVRNHFIN